MPRVRYTPGKMTVEDVQAAAKKLEEASIPGPYVLVATPSALDPALADFLGADKPKRKRAAKGEGREVKGIGDAAFAKLLEEVADMLARGAWEGAQGRHFVALFAELHFRVYGLACDELGPKERVYATKLANDMLAKDFAGDPRAMAEFVAWLWSREKGREEWRREHGRGGGRISWRTQFATRAVLTDFRLEKERKQGKR